MKKNETGRTLLETLAVLALIGLLSVLGLVGYSFLHAYWQKKEFVKEMDTLAIRYRSTPVKPVGEEKYVSIKAIYPSAVRASETAMVLPGGGTVQLKVLNEPGSAFALVTSGVGSEECEEYLRNGGYNALRVPGKGKINPKPCPKDEPDCDGDPSKDPSIVGKVTLNSGDDMEKVIKEICGEKNAGITPTFWFGGCPQHGWSYWHTDGLCHRCAFGDLEDRYGACCPNTAETRATYEGCGVCFCPGNAPKCDTDTGMCVECFKDEHCAGKSGKPYCDLDTHKCVECLDDSDCSDAEKNCPRKCSPSKSCTVSGCDTKTWWKWDASVGCVCKKFIAEGQLCPLDTSCGPGDCCQVGLNCILDEVGKVGRCCRNQGAKGDVCTAETGAVCCADGNCSNGHCCPDGEEWLENQCCIPSDGDPTKCAKTCEGKKPGVCYQCNGVTGTWEFAPNGTIHGCFECVDGVPKDISDTRYPCDSECEVCNHTNGQCDPKSEGTSCGEDVCRQCDGQGSCVLKDETKTHSCGEKCCENECSEKDPNECKKECTTPQPSACHECDDSTGNWVPVKDGTIPTGMTCKWCQSGNLQDKPDVCSFCQTCKTDGSCVADESKNNFVCATCSTCQGGVCTSSGVECGTQCCPNGCDPNDPTKCKEICNKSQDTDCKKCNEKTGVLENMPDHTEVGCMECVAGKLQEKENACGDCQQCNTENKQCEAVKDGTPCTTEGKNNVCYSCKAGTCEPKDPGRTHACGTGNNTVCCVYGCETRKKQKGWNLCRCPNGEAESVNLFTGKKTKKEIGVDDPGYLDEYEPGSKYQCVSKRPDCCHGCVWFFFEKGFTGTYTINIPPNSQGDIWVLRDPGGLKDLVGDYKANGIQYRINGGKWQDLSGGKHDIDPQKETRTYQFKNTNPKNWRKVTVHPQTTYF